MALFTILTVCKGGKYRYCTTEPPHPRRNPRGYYPYHIVVCENKYGRLMLPNELVHHIDEIKTNDSPDNLEFKDRGRHTRDHVLSRFTEIRVRSPMPQSSADVVQVGRTP